MSVSDSAREVLKRYGLSEYESKAYATLVELGSASVRELCKVAAIPSHVPMILWPNLSRRDWLKPRTEDQ